MEKKKKSFHKKDVIFKTYQEIPKINKVIENTTIELDDQSILEDNQKLLY